MLGVVWPQKSFKCWGMVQHKFRNYVWIHFILLNEPYRAAKMRMRILFTNFKSSLWRNTLEEHNLPNGQIPVEFSSILLQCFCPKEMTRSYTRTCSFCLLKCYLLQKMNKTFKYKIFQVLSQIYSQNPNHYMNCFTIDILRMNHVKYSVQLKGEIHAS